MKKVRLITTDQHNGKEAISRTPLRNRYFFEGAWHEVMLTPLAHPEINGVQKFRMPVILRDAQIIEVTEAVFAEMSEEFDIMELIKTVDKESERCMHQATIQRQLCQLRQYGKLNYEVVDDKKGLYRKLSVVLKTCAEQVKMEFKPDWEKRFVEFLKEEGAYEKYVINYKNGPNKESLSDFLKTTPEAEYLNCSFAWRIAPEGYEFWNELSRKWRAIYNGKN